MCGMDVGVRVLEKLVGVGSAEALETVRLLSIRIRIQKRTRRIGIMCWVRVAVGLHFVGGVVVAHAGV